jgi:predicted RNA methylase
MDYTGKSELQESELGLIKYNNFICKVILKAFNQNSSSGNVVLDFGSGSGTLSCILRVLNNKYDYICFDPDDELQKLCKEKDLSRINLSCLLM